MYNYSMIRERSEQKGFSILLIGGFLYALYGVFSRIIGNDIPNFYQYWSRAVVVLVILFALIYFSKMKLKKLNLSEWKWGLVLAVSSGILVPAFFIAVNNLPLGTTIFFFYGLATSVSYVLGSLFLGERLNKVKVMSLLLALAGLVFMYVDTISFSQPLYLAVAAISGLFFGVNISAVRQIGKFLPSLQINLFNWFGSIIVSLPISLILHESITMPILNTPWIANIGLAIVSLLASLSVIFGLKLIEVQKGSIILLSELVFGLILGFVLYKEVPSVLAWVGSGFIFAALLLPNVKIATKSLS